MNFSDSILDSIEEIYTYELIKEAISKYDADMWYQYFITKRISDQKIALKLNKHLKQPRIHDRRTRGGKYLANSRNEFNKLYESEHPRPPKNKNIFDRMIK